MIMSTMRRCHLIASLVLTSAFCCDAFLLVGPRQKNIFLYNKRSVTLLQSSAATDLAYQSYMAKTKPILVVGATGKLGSRIVDKLNQRAIPHRCLVRPSSPNFDKIQQQCSSGVGQIFEGDLSNSDDVRDAVCSDGGIGGCICVSGSFRKRKIRDLVRWGKSNIRDTSHPYIVNHLGMQYLCEAMDELNDTRSIDEVKGGSQQQSSPKLVKVSGVLLSLPKWHYVNLLGNLLYSGVLRWHRKGERDVIDSGIPYTILRPGSFRDDTEYGHLKRGLIISEDGAVKPTLRVKKPMIGIDDLAQVCIDCLDSSMESNGKVLYPRWVTE
mmetsp:Transcript_23154/g.39576  ORF Transcript_23154/g.39576 Transcript_23154/m.39576 type:complete len:325 (+) Transcript_23154:221-1195(+)